MVVVATQEVHQVADLRMAPEIVGVDDEDVADYLRANGLVIAYLGPD